MKEIESALDALFKRKFSVAEKQKAFETRVAAIENEQAIVKQNVAVQQQESDAKISQIRGKIKTAKNGVEKTDLGNETGGKNDLEKFLEGQILELEGELECPVCLEVAKTSPIYKCLDDHLLCRF